MKNNDNNVLEKLEHYSNLFDYYEPLFTEKQKEYFKDYYFYDLSLSEIASNNNISRAAVYDAINKMHIALDDYESKLGLYKNNLVLKEYLNKLENKINDDDLLKIINKMKEVI